ncbi:MAG: 30S ribosomal protein S8 [Candidatus Taylorbacteria bacterium]|nr:30S ribosomal protein S8 [Candidatus Taylorbacteria bacterium]
MVTDYIGDIIIRIKNGSVAGKEIISFPHSKLGSSIAESLLKAGYVKSVETKGKTIAKTVEVGLLYTDGSPRVHDVKRVSHLGRRIYQKSKDIRSFKNGFGNTFYSTPKGILNDLEAKKLNVGGEVLFKIW